MADQRYQDHQRLAKELRHNSHLRPGLSARRAADVISAIANEWTYLVLVRDRRWPPIDYEDRLANQLIAALLT